jgi:glucokinase
LGAAVIDDSKLIRGSSNQSFELGHIPYQKAPFHCGCGKDNCIELFASGLGLERWIRYNKDIEPTKEIKVDLEQLKKDGDEIVTAFEKALVYAVATLITVTNPRVLVLGGGVIEKNPYLIEEIKRSLPAQALSVSLQRVRIVPSSLSNAAMDGAKILCEIASKEKINE